MPNEAQAVLGGTNRGHGKAGGNGLPTAELIRRVGISEQRSIVGRSSTATWKWGSGPGTPAQTTAGRKRPAEETGGRAKAGPSDAAGRTAKKLVRPSRRRPVVVYLCSGLGVSERRACRVVAMPISTSRPTDIGAEGRHKQNCECGCGSWRVRACVMATTRSEFF